MQSYEKECRFPYKNTFYLRYNQGSILYSIQHLLFSCPINNKVD